MTKTRMPDFRATGRRFAQQYDGGVAIFVALALPVLLLISGGTLDYVRYINTTAAMQAAADAAATAAAKEFQLGAGDIGMLSSVAQEFANADLAAKGVIATVSPSINLSTKSVTVTVAGGAESNFLTIIGQAFPAPRVFATAQAVGDSVVCLLALSGTGSSSLALASASVTSPGCAAHSNSTASNGLTASGSAKLTAALICSGGGTSGAQTAFSPQPMTDCPKLADPLDGRATPVITGCDYTDLVLNGGIHTLRPGTYCGGIVAKASAVVTLSGGVFIMKDGPLQLSTGAYLITDEAGAYLTGTNAVLNFDNSTSIDLKAAATGVLAGMLFFEDPTSPLDRTHLIGSRNAPQLLGIIYLPRGKLVVGMTPSGDDPAIDCDDLPKSKGTCPKAPVVVGLRSDWTIVVANHVIINAGVVLTLNANYLSSAIQPPKEIVKKQVRLSN